MSDNEITSALKASAKYLYDIDGDITPEQYQAIDTLRQLINECFVSEGKQVSNQFIYDRLKDVLLLTNTNDRLVVKDGEVFRLDGYFGENKRTPIYVGLDIRIEDLSPPINKQPKKEDK